MIDPASIKDRSSRFNWLMLVAVFALMAFGLAYIFSATMANEAQRNLPWHRQQFFKQAVWYALGMVAAGMVCLWRYRQIAGLAYLAYWASMALLVAVLIPGLGTTHGWGAMRWIDLGPVQLQPSELAKLAFIVAQAFFLSQHHHELNQPRVLLTALGMMVLPFLLIMKEPDLGSALIFLPMGLFMLLVAGVSRKFLATLCLIGATVVALVVVDVLLAPPGWRLPIQDYQRKRLMVYFGMDYARSAPAAERQGLREQQLNDGYNSRQALISVGSGGLTGKGWRQGSQIALGFLPRAVAHNDFIFSVIAEESGFVGSVCVITLYGVILFAGIRIASRVRNGDHLGKLLAVGVVTLLFGHVFINIGMNIRIMPVTGVPLPLLSYGGSSVLCSLVAIGLLQNVHLYQRE